MGSIRYGGFGWVHCGERRLCRGKAAVLLFKSRDELYERHKNNPNRNFDNVVEIDFVDKTPRFSENIPSDFDAVVANHVVEHVPNLLGWFSQLSNTLRDGGLVFLSVPDKRYTFDYFRPTSTLVSILRAADEGLEQPSAWQLAEHYYYHHKVKKEAIWDGILPEALKPRFSLSKAMKMAFKNSKVYTDAHCWVFTPENFAESFAELEASGYLNFTILGIQKTKKGTSEFHVVLQKKNKKGV